MDETNIDNLSGGAQTWETRKFGVEGMTCHHCVQRVETALGQAEGVKEVHVDLGSNTATVTFDSRRTNLPALHDILLKSGYRSSAVAD